MPQFVAVSSTTSTIVTSVDGNSWVPRGVPRNSTFTGVASNGIVTIAAGGTDALKTTDGITWNDSELVSRMPYKAIWGNTKSYAINSSGNLVVICGSATTNAHVAFTTDGIRWQATNLPAKGIAWQAVASKGSDFVALGTSGGAGVVARSTDGITWNSTTTTGMATLSYTDIDANSSIYVAVATGTQQYARSTDGVTWTSPNMPASSTWNSILYNGSIFCATTSSGIGAVSTDGITWTQTTLPSSLAWVVVSWTGVEFIIIKQGVSASDYAVSTNGITWTVKAFPQAGAYMSVTTNATRTFWLATTNTNATLSSTDGNTWSLYNYPISATWISLFYKNKFLTYQSTSVGDYTFNINNDGIAWYPNGVSASSYKIRYLNNEFISLHLSRSAYASVITSTDGNTWDSPVIVTTSSFTPNDIAYGNGMYVLTGSGGNVYRSTDLITWTQCSTSAGAASMNGVTYGDEKFVAVGATSKIIYSTDGITWGTATAAAASRTLQNIIYTGTVFIAVDTVGSVHRSLDGISWITTFTNPGSNTLYASSYSPALNEVVSVGAAGIILNSTT